MIREAAIVLESLGFVSDVDFIATQKTKDDIEVIWLSQAQQPTAEEIEAAWPAVQAALAQAAQEKQTADDQQREGIDQAKRAYARLQTIIDNADTATTAQLRAAIKEMAGTIQHLIRAAVR